jgi:hypothetical protein
MSQKKVRLLMGHGTISIEPRELKGVKPGEWLNDEVVNGYVELIKQVATPNIILLSSFFMSKLARGDNVEKDWKRVSYRLFHKVLAHTLALSKARAKGFILAKHPRLFYPSHSPWTVARVTVGHIGPWLLLTVDNKRSHISTATRS